MEKVLHEIFNILVSSGISAIAVMIINRYTRQRYLDRMCKECKDRQEHNLNIKINKQIANAVVILNEIFELIETDFNAICVSKLNFTAEELLKSDQYVKFEEVWTEIEELLIELLKTQYRANNFAGLRVTELLTRCKNFWNILYSSYTEDFIIVPPPRDTMRGILLNKKQEIMEMFRRLYSKEVYEV